MVYSSVDGEVISRLLQKHLRYSDLTLQVDLHEVVLLIVFNLKAGSSISYDDLVEEAIDALRIAPLSSLQSIYFYGRLLGCDDCQWQRQVFLPLPPPQSKSRLSPDLTSSEHFNEENVGSISDAISEIEPNNLALPSRKYRNATEGLVRDEVKSQLQSLEPIERENIDLAQAIAYALNRLPPMYATTENGWWQLRQRINTHTVHKVVSSAFSIIKQAPHLESELTPTDLQTQAQILSRLAKIFSKKNLRWRDVPDVLERKIYLANGRKPNTFAWEIKRYLKRSKMREISSDNIYLAELGKVEVDWFNVYMAEAEGSYINVMEHLVSTIITEEIIPSEEINILADLDIDDVIAYALNRLPPMYATCDRGKEFLLERANKELRDTIINIIKEGIEITSQNSKRDVAPLPFERFERELSFALQEVKQILQRNDISLQNLVEIMENELSSRGIYISDWL